MYIHTNVPIHKLSGNVVTEKSTILFVHTKFDNCGEKKINRDNRKVLKYKQPVTNKIVDQQS